MKIPFKDFGYTIKIEPYTVAQEKELLFLETYYPEFDDDILDAALDILKLDSKIYSKLSHDEKVILLYKYREVSVDEKFSIHCVCSACGMPIETEVSITNIVNRAQLKSEFVKDLKRLPEDEKDFQNNFLTKNYEDLDIDTYESIYENISKYQTANDFIRKFKCMSCGHEAYINLNSNKTVISSLSEASIESIYNFYENLIFTGKWSKKDIDSLLPFERVIFNSLYNESVKKHNEAVEKFRR